MTPGRRHTIAHVLGAFELDEDMRGRPHVVTWPDGCEALAIAVESAWAHGPENLLSSVLAGHGQGFEGVVAYGYGDGEVHDVGVVCCYYLDEDTELQAADFEAYVVAYAQLAAGTSDEPPSELTMQRIEALRARLATR